MKIEMKTQNQTDLTFQKPYRSLRYQLLTRGGATLERLGLNLASLDKESLLEEAKRQTRLNDFGDGRFHIPLSILLDSLKKEASLNFLGKLLFRERLINFLINRLEIQESFKNNPKIKQVSLKKPLFIIGAHRTGTTFLFNLLARDPNSRWLRFWESFFPVSTLTPEDALIDPRIKKVTKITADLKSFLPYVDIAHYLDARNPEECNPLFERNFTSDFFMFLVNVPSYYQWLKKQPDLIYAYEYYHFQLQLLSCQWQEHHWLLKSPFHLSYLEDLLTIFPDANIIQTHRDPLKSLPSICSLSSMFRSLYSDRIQPSLVGKQWLDLITKLLTRGLKARQNISNNQFFDLNYIDLIKDPLGSVRQIYAHFGYDFSPTMEKNIQKYIQENWQHKHGVHRYSLEQFSLAPNLVKEKLKDYYDRFNIVSEN
ncbi:MAG: sulfotransferase [Prochloraceae cyanobacterium]|nr:sulfotransferase [Prochloraceae cyanobacterium]